MCFTPKAEGWFLLGSTRVNLPTPTKGWSWGWDFSTSFSQHTYHHNTPGLGGTVSQVYGLTGLLAGADRDSALSCLWGIQDYLLYWETEHSPIAPNSKWWDLWHTLLPLEEALAEEWGFFPTKFPSFSDWVSFSSYSDFLPRAFHQDGCFLFVHWPNDVCDTPTSGQEQTWESWVSSQVHAF